jgi:hypothetical protein
MKPKLNFHAQGRQKNRQISNTAIALVLKSPDKRVTFNNGTEKLQKRMNDGRILVIHREIRSKVILTEYYT